jgi:2,5-diketo-D-gluconate reductase A
MATHPFPTVKLSNGVAIPLMGFGCADFAKGPVLDRAVAVGLEAGYRFFDNAPFYKDEAEVGAALRASGIERKELFISTKLPNSCHAYDAALKSFDNSLKKMGLEYFDMYLIHFPCPKQGLYTEAWQALEKLYEEGRVRVIGVSNFQERHLLKILEMGEIKPLVNEIECNPYLSLASQRDFHAQHNIQTIAWFPLGGPIGAIEPPASGIIDDSDPIEAILSQIRLHNLGKKVLLKDQVLAAIGKKYGKTTAQVILRWHIESGIIPIPKSKNPGRLRENADIFDFELTAGDKAAIAALDHNRRLGPEPDLFEDHDV